MHTLRRLTVHARSDGAFLHICGTNTLRENQTTRDVTSLPRSVKKNPVCMYANTEQFSRTDRRWLVHRISIGQGLSETIPTEYEKRRCPLEGLLSVPFLLR